MKCSALTLILLIFLLSQTAQAVAIYGLDVPAGSFFITCVGYNPTFGYANMSFAAIVKDAKFIAITDAHGECAILQNYTINGVTYPYVVWSRYTPVNVSIRSRLYGYTPVYATLLYVQLTSEAPPAYTSIAPTGRGDFLSGLTGTFNFLGGIINNVIQSITAFGTAIPQAFGNAINFVGGMIGRTGDPTMAAQVAQYRLMLMPFLTSPYYSDIANRTLNSQLPLKSVAHLISVKPEHMDKTLAQLENEQPTGILGWIGTVWWFLWLSETQQFIAFMIKNFVLIHIILILAILALGLTDTIKKRDLNPLLKSFDFVKELFLAYYKFFNWLANLILRVAQVIATVIEALWPF